MKYKTKSVIHKVKTKNKIWKNKSYEKKLLKRKQKFKAKKCNKFYETKAARNKLRQKL